METRILSIFTRTPLHVGTGNSVGAVDSPIIRERHTGFPIIPGTALKGVFADEWTRIVEKTRKNKKTEEEEKYLVGEKTEDGIWLFGAEDANAAASGAILIGEAKLLAFPIRSAKGAFAWITSPMIIRRAIRDGVLSGVKPESIADIPDEKASFIKNGTVGFADKIVLEEYTFDHAGDLPPNLSDKLAKIIAKDPVWGEITKRLVILSDGMMTHFCLSACEVVQHVRIDDATGTAAPGALFNQENVPSETMFYSVLNFVNEKSKSKGNGLRSAKDAEAEFRKKLNSSGNIFQFGGDASTGLGYCTVELINKDGQ